MVANNNVQTDVAGCLVTKIDVSASTANCQLLFLFNYTVQPAVGFFNVTWPGTTAVCGSM